MFSFILFCLTLSGVRAYDGSCAFPTFLSYRDTPTSLMFEKGKHVCSLMNLGSHVQIVSDRNDDLPDSVFCTRNESLSETTKWSCTDSNHKSVQGIVSWEDCDGKVLENSFKFTITKKLEPTFGDFLVMVVFLSILFICGLVFGFEFWLGMLLGGFCSDEDFYSSGSKIC